MSVVAALLFAMAFLLFVLDFLGWVTKPLQSLALASLTAGLFCALADNSNTVHF